MEMCRVTAQLYCSQPLGGLRDFGFTFESLYNHWFVHKSKCVYVPSTSDFSSPIHFSCFFKRNTFQTYLGIIYHSTCTLLGSYMAGIYLLVIISVLCHSMTKTKSTLEVIHGYHVNQAQGSRKMSVFVYFDTTRT